MFRLRSLLYSLVSVALLFSAGATTVGAQGVSWTHTWGGSATDSISGMSRDTSGNLYLAGSTSSFGTGSEAALVLKYDPNGNLLWARTWGGASYDVAIAVAVGPDGNIYITGGTQSFGAGSVDVLLLKFDPQGDLLWSKTWGGSSFDDGHDIAFDASGNVLVGAETYSYNPPNKDVSSGAVLKFTPDGTLLWSRIWTSGVPMVSGPVYDGGYSVDVDSNGNIVLVGVTWDYNVSPNHNSIFVVKWDSSGNLLWNRNWAGTSEDEVSNTGGEKLVRFDPTGNIYIAGGTASACTSSNFSTCDFDVLALKIDPNGNLLWSATWKPDAGYDYVTSLAFDMSGGAVSDIVLSGTKDVYGSTDAPILLRLDPNGNLLSSLAWSGGPGAAGSAVLTDAARDIFVGGNAPNITGVWQSITGVSGTENGTLSTQTTSAVASPAVTLGTPSGTVTSPTGVADTGGGGQDAFVSVIPAGYTPPGGQPVAAISPSPLNFPNQTVNTTSGELAVTVRNTGGASLGITDSPSIGGSNAGDFAVASGTTCASGASVSPGSSCVVEVTFRPSTDAAESAVLYIYDNATGSPQTVALNGTGSAALPPSHSVTLSDACVNGLQVDVNGGATPGAFVADITWNWGDGTTTTGFFPESHTYLLQGQYTIHVTALYTDGSSTSASQTVNTAPGILATCSALTITAGQYGSVSYQASVGSGVVPAGSYVTLQLDYADDLSVESNASPGFSFASWTASTGISGTGGGAINSNLPSIEIVADGTGTLNANFSLSVALPPTPTSTPPLSQFPSPPQLFTSQGATFLTSFEGQTSPNVQGWLTDSSIQTNVSSAANLLSLSNLKQTFGDIKTGASLVSDALGIAGLFVNPTSNTAADYLLTGVGLLQGTPEFGSTLSATQQIAITGVSTAISCTEAAATAGSDVVANTGCVLSIGSDAATLVSLGASALQSDPPDPDYAEIFEPEPIEAIPVPLAGIAPNLAAASWASLNSLDQTAMWMNAIRVTANRYGTALAANDGTSAGRQYLAFLNYLGLYIQTADNASSNLAALANIMQSEGVGTQPVSNNQLAGGLDYLATQGVTSTFLNQFFATLGFTPFQIQTMIQQALANPPSPPAASPVLALQTLSNTLVSSGVHLGSSSPSLILDSATGQYDITINLVNTGSVAIDVAQIKAATTTLGAAPAITASGSIINLAPWEGAAVTLSFPATAIPKGSTSASLKINGTYSAGTLSGNWSLTFRSVTLAH